MKKASKGAIWLVEYRIFSLPRTLSADALSGWHRHNNKETGSKGSSKDSVSVTLLDLQTWWKNGGYKIARSEKFRDFSDQRFGNGERLTYRAIRHPENTVTEPEGGELLEIALDAKALSSIRNYLGDDSSRNAWRLNGFSAYIPVQSRFGIQISVFSPNDSKNLKPENLDHFSNQTAQRIDRLWPIVYSALCLADDKIFGSAADARKNSSVLWTDDEQPFGLPAILLAKRELDPTEEYDFYNVLFVNGQPAWARACEPFSNIESLESFKKYEITANGGGKREAISLSRAMTLWQVPSLTRKEDVIERVLRVSLASRLMKNLTYNYRLLAYALKENYLDGKGLGSEELREIAFRYDIAHQALSERRQYLSKTEYDITQLHLDLSSFDEYVDNCAYLSGRVLMAAESVDADNQRRFEVKLQVIALSFAALALITVLLDGYNFIFGQPGEMPLNSSARNVYLSGVFSTALFVALVLIFKTKVKSWLRKSR